MVPYSYTDNWQLLEQYNTCPMGTVLDWTEQGPVRKPCEYDPIIMEAQQTAVSLACKNLRLFKVQKNKELIVYFLKNMANSFTVKNTKFEHEH
jgi:hypothetical protein